MDLRIPLAAFGLGVALGASPGPVQLLLLSESSRGGAGRGLRAMAGANGTFGLMLLLLAAGLSSLEPGPTFLRVMEVIGGGFLVFLAADAFRESRRSETTVVPRPGMDPALRGVIAVVVNPGVYLFLASTGTAVVASAAEAGGRSLAFVTVLTLLLGVSTLDLGMVLLGAGAHRVSDRFLRILGDVLAIALGGLGVWLIVQGLLG